MILEWYMAGGIPALRPDSEIFRFTVKINGITHILAIMNKIVAILSAGYLICREKKSKNDSVILMIFCLSTLMIFLTAMRGELVVIFFVVGILICCKHKISFFRLFLLVVPIMVFIAIYPIIRKCGIYGELFIMDQQAISTYSNIWYFSPLYQTLCDSVGVFGTVTKMFPTSYSYGIIEYSVVSQIPFVHLGRNVSAEIGDFLNSSFYSGLTSTYLGTCYADGGVIGAFIYTFIMAVWARYIFNNYVRTKNFQNTILYAYMFYNILMLSYGNTIIELSFVIYCFVINFFSKLIKK